MWHAIVDSSGAIHFLIVFSGSISGTFIAGLGLLLAIKKHRLLAQNSLREQYQMGMDLLNIKPRHHTARVAGVTILSQILNSKSTEYDNSILRSFESFLFSPPVFSGNIGRHKAGEIDYESRDTYTVVIALRRYVKQRNAKNMLSLPEGLPFVISQNWVEPNRDYPDYKRWIEARGKPPEYED